ncbi:MAG: hypothetical protein ACP5OG_04075 [Candidatus Nanoarchaeia archaeon]
MKTKITTFPLQTQEPQRIGYGKDGMVYKISQNHAAKTVIMPSDKEAHRGISVFNNVKALAKEYLIAKMLNENNVNAAYPYGLFGLEFKNNTRPAYVMEYLDGDNLYKLSRKLSLGEMSRLEQKMFQEIYKVGELGIGVWDDMPRNAIWTPKNDKVYLIDFADWTLPLSMEKEIDVLAYEYEEALEAA